MFNESKLDKAIDTVMDFWCEWGAIILALAFFAGITVSHGGPWIAVAVAAAIVSGIAGAVSAVRASR